VVQAGQAKKKEKEKEKETISKITRAKKSRDEVQVVKLLPSKHKALNSNLNIAKQERNLGLNYYQTKLPLKFLKIAARNSQFIKKT
jgi:hypothetical protein